MAGGQCECGASTASFIIEHGQLHPGRLASVCPGCKRKYSFILPADPTHPVLPPTILKTHMEGDVIFVDHWKDAQGEVGG